MPCKCSPPPSTDARDRLFALAQGDQMEVEWAIQPDGVTIYVMRSGHQYRVRNAHERIVVYRVDIPELQELGLIAPKEL